MPDHASGPQPQPPASLSPQPPPSPVTPTPAGAPAASTSASTEPRLVVFDFDHTLFRGDSGAMLIRWLIQRHWQRTLLALLVSPLLAPLFLFIEARRAALSAYLWIATVGWRRRDFEHHLDKFVAANAPRLREALILPGLERLGVHLAAGDRVVIATGAPPQLIARILEFVAHQHVPVIGTVVGPRLRAIIAIRHCHAQRKLRMLREAGYSGPIARAYSDSIADLPLLQAAREPVAINPEPRALAAFRRCMGERLQEERW